MFARWSPTQAAERSHETQRAHERELTCVRSWIHCIISRQVLLLKTPKVKSHHQFGVYANDSSGLVGVPNR